MAAPPERPITVPMMQELFTNHELLFREAARPRLEGTPGVRRVAILGGGTAGWLTALALRLGDGHACALTPLHTVSCWGSNLHGELGDGSRRPREAPAEVPGLELETKDDVRRFLEAITRRALRARYLDELDNSRTALTVAAELPRLATERCRLAEGLAP